MSLSEKGEGKVGTIIGLVLVILLALALFEFVPKKIATVKLADFCMEQARFGGRSEKKIKKRIYDVANQLRLPVKMEDIKVEVSHRILIQVNYTVPLELPLGIKHDWRVSHNIDEIKISF